MVSKVKKRITAWSILKVGFSLIVLAVVFMLAYVVYVVGVVGVIAWVLVMG